MSFVSTPHQSRGGQRRGRSVFNAIPEPLEARQLFAATLFSENFDGLAYGPNQEETTAGENVWTNVAPAGWVKDDTGIPGVDEPPENNGIKEWIGWTFAQKDWWVQAAGDQDRGLFTKASGGVMIADPDEWDDAAHPAKPAGWPADMLYNAKITTPAISLVGVTPGTVNVDFDSTWKPEGFDDGEKVNNQTGIIEAVYSDGTPTEILHWDSDPFGEFFKADSTDEHVTLPLDVPAGATSVQLRFTLGQAANDWFWAVDNLAVTGEGGVTPAVTVQQVFVNGATLTGGTPNANQAEFRAKAGIDSTFGYPLPGGANQLKSLPWTSGINQIALRFTQDVASELQQGDLEIRGTSNATYTPTAFTYDAATKTGVWTLPSPILNDKVRLFLDDAKLSGLDGEWANPTAAAPGGDAYPSGDAAAGGDFDFRFNVLRGDATQDGTVNAQDLSFIKQRLNKTATNPGTTGATYSVFGDLTADGQINAQDLSAAKQRLNNKLPTADPATALLFSGKTISR